jgi:hypothetical protein
VSHIILYLTKIAGGAAMNDMNEKLYKSLGRAGGFGIAIGIIEIVIGIILGTLTIINGAKLIKEKANIMF